jgi:hypothetical protein
MRVALECIRTKRSCDLCGRIGERALGRYGSFVLRTALPATSSFAGFDPRIC